MKDWVVDNMEAKDNIIKLSEMREGDSGRIERVGGAGAFRRRVLEMGLIKGTEVYVEKYAPLKDPIELIIKGYHISLRVEEAAQVLIRPDKS